MKKIKFYSSNIKIQSNYTYLKSLKNTTLLDDNIPTLKIDYYGIAEGGFSIYTVPNEFTVRLNLPKFELNDYFSYFKYRNSSRIYLSNKNLFNGIEHMAFIPDYCLLELFRKGYKCNNITGNLEGTFCITPFRNLKNINYINILPTSDDLYNFISKIESLTKTTKGTSKWIPGHVYIDKYNYRKLLYIGEFNSYFDSFNGIIHDESNKTTMQIFYKCNINETNDLNRFNSLNDLLLNIIENTPINYYYSIWGSEIIFNILHCNKSRPTFVDGGKIFENNFDLNKFKLESINYIINKYNNNKSLYDDNNPVNLTSKITTTPIDDILLDLISITRLNETFTINKQAANYLYKLINTNAILNYDNKNFNYSQNFLGRISIFRNSKEVLENFYKKVKDSTK